MNYLFLKFEIAMSLDLSKGCRNYKILLETLIGEAEDQPFKGQLAICYVILHRVCAHKTYWYDETEGNGIAGVCLKDGQFECWNKSRHPFNN